MLTAIIVNGIVLILFVLVGSVVLQLTGGSPRAQVDQGQVWETPLLSGEVETLKLMDFTGDGRLDLAIANSDAPVISLLAGLGDGGFSTRRWVSSEPTWHWHASGGRFWPTSSSCSPDRSIA